MERKYTKDFRTSVPKEKPSALHVDQAMFYPVRLMSEDEFDEAVSELKDEYHVYSRCPSKMIDLFEEWASRQGRLPAKLLEKATECQSASEDEDEDEDEEAGYDEASEEKQKPTFLEKRSTRAKEKQESRETIEYVRHTIRKVLFYRAFYEFLLPLDSQTACDDIGQLFNSQRAKRPTPGKSLGKSLQDTYIVWPGGLSGLREGNRIAYFYRDAGWFGSALSWSQGHGTVKFSDENHVVLHDDTQFGKPVRLSRAEWSRYSEKVIWIHRDDLHNTAPPVKITSSSASKRREARRRKAASQDPTQITSKNSGEDATLEYTNQLLSQIPLEWTECSDQFNSSSGDSESEL